MRELKATLNKKIEGRTQKEYYVDTKKDRLDYQYKYYKDNKDKRLDYQNLYYKEHKDIILIKNKQRYFLRKQNNDINAEQ